MDGGLTARYRPPQILQGYIVVDVHVRIKRTSDEETSHGYSSVIFMCINNKAPFAGLKLG